MSDSFKLFPGLNLGTLADALSVLFTKEETLDGAKKVVGQEYPQILTTYRSEMRKNKLGLNEWNESLDESLWKPIYNVLIGLDYTIFFRQLSNSKINPQSASAIALPISAVLPLPPISGVRCTPLDSMVSIALIIESCASE